MTDQLTILEKLIVREIDQAGGWLSFARFMFLALNAPGLGYYSSQKKIFGYAPEDGSDFITGPEENSFFARVLARPIAQILSQMDLPHILEFGAGTGKLAVDLLNELSCLGYSSVHYTIIETSANMKWRQFNTIKKHCPHFLSHVNWENNFPSFFQGVILANEVLDAFPVQLIVNRNGFWYERGVRVKLHNNQNFDQPFNSSIFEWEDSKDPINIKRIVGIDPKSLDLLRDINGYLTEVHQQAYVFANRIANFLMKGAAFIIDYGFPEREYYHPDRYLGTLMCHFKHRAHGDPLIFVGNQDITAHVNFTGIASAVMGEASWCGYAPQGRFLIESGLVSLLKDLNSSFYEKSALLGHVNRLISPAEMGELFKIFSFGKEVKVPDAFMKHNRIASLYR